MSIAETPSTASPSFWSQPDVIEMFERAQSSEIGRKTKQWLEAETELSRLTERLTKLEAERGDKVMAAMVRTKITEQTEYVHRRANVIAETPAKNAIDIIWKLCVSRDVGIRMADQNAPSVQLSTSALDDLMRFVRMKQNQRSELA